MLDRKKLITGIIVVLIIIIIIIFLIINSLKVNSQEDDNFIIGSNEETEQGYEETEQGFTEERDPTMFYTVANYIQDFINYLNFNNMEQNSETYIASIERYTDGELVRESLKKQLNEEYVKKNGITENNVIEKLNKLSKKITFTATDMFVKYGDEGQVQIYIVKGFQGELNTEDELEQTIYILYMDNMNSTYSIVPIVDNTLENIEDIALEFNVNNIEVNDYNVFDYVEMNEQAVASKYFSFYKNLSIYHPDKAYEYLNEEYRDKRFGSVDEYKKYISENKDDINELVIKSYLVEDGNKNSQEYVCRDQYKNLYIFNETSVMKFSITLDTYTLSNEKFNDTYNSVNNENKVKMNIDKWIQMINNRDYNSAYNVLDNDFKNNYFSNLNEFKDNIKKDLYSYYEIEFGDITEETGLYIQEIKLKDMKSEDVREKSIIMKLNENSEFTMSYNTVDRRK